MESSAISKSRANGEKEKVIPLAPFSLSALMLEIIGTILRARRFQNLLVDVLKNV